MILKDSQLHDGFVEQTKSKEQILIRTKAMEATTDGIFIVDAKKPFFPVIYANPSFQLMIGLGKEDIYGKNYFLLYGAEADARIIEEIRCTILQGKSFHGEMLNFRKDGQKYWNLLRIAPVRDNGGSVTHYVGIQTDVTMLRKKDLEIKEQHDDLLHVTRVGKLAEFVSSLAHEISQPLTAIQSYAQAASRMLGDREPKIREILQHIIGDDQRAAEVIRRMRALLKKSEPEMKSLDINALIDETITLVSADLTIRNSILRTELSDNIPLLYGDHVQIQQVLLNLISNSFDAMEMTQNFREILISTAFQDDGFVKITVKDSGCGIPVDNVPKLFTRFFTSKQDGLGMGLSISRSIVEGHGGSLDVKKDSENGATFYFTIPVGRLAHE